MTVEQVEFLQATIQAIHPARLGYRDDQNRIHEIVSIDYKSGGNMKAYAALNSFVTDERSGVVGAARVTIEDVDPDRFCMVSMFRIPRLG